MTLKCAVFALGIVASCTHSKPQPVTLGAAISLKESIGELAPRLEKDSQTEIHFSYGASGELAGEWNHGAPFDVLAAAGDERVEADEACTLAWNTLALVKPRGKPSVDWSALASSPSSFRLAIGLTPQVPAGVYAEDALHRVGAWDALASKIVRGTNVRNVLDLVARGEADEGIVYATDVKVRSDVELVALVPASARPERALSGVRRKARERSRARGHKTLCGRRIEARSRGARIFDHAHRERASSFRFASSRSRSVFVVPVGGAIDFTFHADVVHRARNRRCARHRAARFAAVGRSGICSCSCSEGAARSARCSKMRSTCVSFFRARVHRSPRPPSRFRSWRKARRQLFRASIACSKKSRRQTVLARAKRFA